MDAGALGASTAGGAVSVEGGEARAPSRRTESAILDNYIIHKSRLTLAWMRERGVRLRLHFLPPYCPNANRIERLWWDLHAHVTRNHTCRTMLELMRAVHRYLAERFELVEVVAYAA